MSKHPRTSNSGALLELWRPPDNAGDPIGCLSTTFTFDPGLFDEQCLARFLDIDSEPNRESLAFLLEREDRLGGVYAGVLVDYTNAGVSHSLRWDVLPVRVRAAKQHSKVTLLAWSRRARIIVASGNLTQPGYRTNQEVVATVELSPNEADHDMFADTVGFLRALITLVPGSSKQRPEIERAEVFLSQAERLVRGWNHRSRRGTSRQRLVCTFPVRPGVAARSSLEEAVWTCRERGGSPDRVKVASPFFDADDSASQMTAALCKLMARGRERDLCFCVPGNAAENKKATARLAAPKAILTTPKCYQAKASVRVLPVTDADKNTRAWHAKMFSFDADDYSAVMVGSSNFTCAGMGVRSCPQNVEANLLTVVDYRPKAREISQLQELWPAMDKIPDPDSAEWLGSKPEEEDDTSSATPLPLGFVSATYCAGEQRSIILRLDPANLPENWVIHACGLEQRELLSSPGWASAGKLATVELPWAPPEPPERLLVQWAEHKAFLPLNVKDSRALPPPLQLEQMSADDMLGILAAADPSAAYRAWIAKEKQTDGYDGIDSAAPIDLDPLRRYDLQATFLHRIRRRARVLAQLRSNLERPVWGRQALEWRLRGLVGIDQLATRLLKEFENANGTASEALLALADFLVVLREVRYQPADGSLSTPEFDAIFDPFVRELGDRLTQCVQRNGHSVSTDIMQFWERVVERCQA